MPHQYATLEDTVYFWFGANDTSGSGNDGASAAADVRLAGAAAGAAPVLSPSPTLLSHANYPQGCYEVAVTATAGNGFAATNTYAVFCTLLVDSQNPTGFIGSFTLDPVIANVKEISDDSTAADNLELDYDGTGYAKANSTIGTTTANTDMRGTDSAALASVATEARLAELDAANIPADIDSVLARLPVALVSGRMSSDAVAISGSTSAADQLEASALTIVSGAVEAGTLSTTQMTSDLSEATDDHYIGRIIIWTSGVLQNQASDITDYAGANGLLTFTAVTEAPSAADTFIIV